MDDDSDDDQNAITSTHELRNKITAEFDIYKNISLKGDEKNKLVVIDKSSVWLKLKYHLNFPSE